MTARHVPDRTAATVAVSATSLANGSHGLAPALPRWEDWFEHASASQRADILHLAATQGLVYLHQLPAPAGANGRKAAATSSQTVERLAQLLGGAAGNLPNLGQATLTFADAALDPLQREAVCRAVTTPDVCLLQGFPGTGKSRVVAEIVLQAARQGRRVLFLAPRPAALDVVLKRLAGNAEILALRYTDVDERPEAFPAWLRALTLAEQQPAFRERALAGARHARERAEGSCLRRKGEEACWPPLERLAEAWSAVRNRLQELHVRSMENELSGAASPGLLELEKTQGPARAALDADRTVLQEKNAGAARELQALQRACIELEPKVQARQKGRWWTLGYWTGAAALKQLEGLRGQEQDVQARIRDTGVELAEVAARIGRLTQAQRAEREDLVRGENARRHDELMQERLAVEQEVERLRQSWDALCLGFESRPADPSPEALATAYKEWKRRLSHDEAECQFARQWAQFVEEAGEQHLPRLPALANVLAGTTAALAAERSFAEAAAGCDLLVIEEADGLTEAELLRLARLTSRLVLIGDALAGAEPLPRDETPTRSIVGLKPLASGCWSKLWHALDGDLARRPCAWSRDRSRLFCHLAAVRPEDAKYVETERLADAPDIELHILGLPQRAPTLARVSFPAAFTIPEATAFLWRELQELPLQAGGRTAWWQESETGWNWHLAPSDESAAVRVATAPGVNVVFSADRPVRVEFTAGAGWTQESARSWLEAQLSWRDCGRTVFLQRPYRMRPKLAADVAPVFFSNAEMATPRDDETSGLEFHPVPSLRKPELPRDGAGLELDLSGPRQADRLPSEFRSSLPRSGFVNYLEAQAVVCRLEQWVLNPAELEEASGNVLVLALYEGQAELLRQLVQRSDLLRPRPFGIEIGVPEHYRHREFDVVLLSMTRSHAHRCVPFGASLTDLTLAFTRARRRLIVFGDLGALAKRSHWQGPLDHLDARSAQLERGALARLLQWLGPRIDELVCAAAH